MSGVDLMQSQVRMVDGHAVSAEHQRIAEIIKDYNEDLELAWIPPQLRSNDDTYPFAVIHRPKTGGEYIVFRLREDEVDHRVLARLFAGDLSKGDPVAAAEASEAAQRLIQMKREEDLREERAEIAQWAIKAKAGSTLKPGVRLD